MRVSAEVVVPLPAERVFERLARWEEQPRWMRDADRVDVVGSQREGPGVRLRVRTRVLGLPLLTDVMEIVAWEPGRRIDVVHRRPVRGHGSWRLRPVSPAATRLSWVEDLRLPVPVLGELLLLAYRPLMRRLMCASLRALRASLMDGGGGAPGDPR